MIPPVRRALDRPWLPASLRPPPAGARRPAGGDVEDGGYEEKCFGAFDQGNGAAEGDGGGGGDGDGGGGGDG